MTFVRNMKIRRKLLAGFFLMVVITVFIAVFGIYSIRTIDASYTLMMDHPAERYNMTVYLHADIMDFRRLVASMAFRLGDVVRLNELHREASAARATVDEHLDSYQNNMRNDAQIDPARREELLQESSALRAMLHRYSDEVLEGMFAAAIEGVPGDAESRARVEGYFELGAEIYAEIASSFLALRDGALVTRENRYREIQATADRSTMVMLVFTFIGVVLGLSIAVFISGMVTNPVVLLTKALGDVANGDLTKRLPDRGGDEIGQASRSYNLSMNEFSKMISSIKSQSSELSDIGNNLASNMAQTAASMNEIAANIHNVKTRVLNQSASVTETNATMEQVTVNINKLSDHVDLQSNAVSQASSAIEQMIANIQSVTATLARNAANVTELRESSETGRYSLQEVAADIQEIARESEGLMEINSVMENIASQTSLLSMNAAIEAAHAGDAGKGFAVVADEIRKLAESSGEQSKTIGNVLKKITGSIDKITSSTDNVLNKFEAIDQSVRTVADQEEAIRNAMEEQAEGSKQVLAASGQVGEITQQVKSGSAQMLEGSKEVIQESKNLERATQEITSGINEMAIGAEDVNRAVNVVNELSGRTRENISILAQAVARFKV